MGRGLYAYAMVLVFVLGLGVGYGASVPRQRTRDAQVGELIRLNREFQAELSASHESLERAAGLNEELRAAQREAVELIASAAVDLGTAAARSRGIEELITPVYDALGRIADIVRVLGFGEYIITDALEAE